MDKEFEIEGNEALAEIADSAARGETVVLTRRGKVVAAVLPRKTPSPPRLLSKAEAEEAMQRIRQIRKGQSLGPDVTFKDLVNGRR